MPGNGNKDINTVPRKNLSGEMYQPDKGTPTESQIDIRIRYSDI